MLTDYFGTTKKEPRLHVVHPDRNPDNRLYVHSNKTSFSSQKMSYQAMKKLIARLHNSASSVLKLSGATFLVNLSVKTKNM
ncbi:hypothetical protein EFM7_1309 [Enterococcus faecalis M7]|nr:hypothetical protein EFM7_1309 [Enterococcus faecalis M7]